MLGCMYQRSRPIALFSCCCLALLTMMIGSFRLARCLSRRAMISSQWFIFTSSFKEWNLRSSCDQALQDACCVNFFANNLELIGGWYVGYRHRAGVDDELEPGRGLYALDRLARMDRTQPHAPVGRLEVEHGKRRDHGTRALGPR